MRVFTIRNRKNGFTQKVTEENWNNPRMWPEISKMRFRIVANEEANATGETQKAIEKPVVVVPKEVMEFKESKDKQAD